MSFREQASVTVEERGDAVVLAVEGEIDVANATGIGTLLERGVGNDVSAAIVDLTALEFVDSSGIRMLFELAGRLGERRLEARIVAPAGGTIQRTLELVDFDRAAPVHPTLDAALADLGAGTAEPA